MQKPGEHYGVPDKPYVWRASGRPVPTTYMLGDVEHRFDGTCHDDCSDVR